MMHRRCQERCLPPWPPRAAAAVPLMRVRLALPVPRLARGAAVAHLPASLAVLAGERLAAEVAAPDDWQQLDGRRVTARRSPVAPQRCLHKGLMLVHFSAQRKRFL